MIITFSLTCFVILSAWSDEERCQKLVVCVVCTITVHFYAVASVSGLCSKLCIQPSGLLLKLYLSISQYAILINLP